MRARACVPVCVRAYVCARACVCVCVHQRLFVCVCGGGSEESKKLKVFILLVNKGVIGCFAPLRKVALGLLITVAVHVLSSIKSHLFLVLFRFIGCEPVWPSGKALGW